MISERAVFVVRIVTYAVLAVLLLIVALFPLKSYAQAIPRDAEKYRRDLTREARAVWGLDAPVSALSAQIEQESGFREDARSSAGAVGLAQFIPSTAAWISGAYPALADNDPKSPRWALRAMSTYMRHIYTRAKAADSCHQYAFSLAEYNGGGKFLAIERELAKRSALNPNLWWRNVEMVNGGRSASNFKENRSYPPSILFKRQPKYVAAGWGAGMCET